MDENAASTLTRHIDKNTLIGIAAMTGSMAAFAFNDTCVKLLGEQLPTGQIITIRNGLATILIFAIAALQSVLRAPAATHQKATMLRVAGDVIATWCMVLAVILLPIADATAISQFAPVAITLAAALWLGEHVGWRRWTAILIGLFGVFLIVRPGTAGFSIAGLLPLAAVVFIVGRDLITRSIGNAVPALMIAGLSTAAGAMSGLIGLSFESWRTLEPYEILLGIGSAISIAAAYVLIIIGMRYGDVATVSPFRYTVIAFALIPGWLIWKQSPDAVQFIGILLLICAGLYTLRHESRTTIARV